MPDGTRTDIVHLRLVSVAMPAAATPPLGEWHRRGSCAGEDPDTFFPAHGAPGTRAREICAACAVRTHCLDYATGADEFGIWGGLDQHERRLLPRRNERHNSASSPENSRSDRLTR
jgi:WhiB family transcriptional regulator, redox-sensing transcriptional regulator